MTPKIAFIDIDGTLLNSRGEVPPSATRAIRSARARGHQVVLATGRSPLEIDEQVTAIGFDGAITAAGAYVEYGGVRIDTTEFAAADAQRIARCLDDLGIDRSLQGRGGIYPNRGHRERMLRVLTERNMLHWLEVSASARMHVTDAGESTFDGVASVVFSSDEPHAYFRVQQALGDQFAVVPGTLPGLGTGGGEIAPPGVNKGRAVMDLIAHLGIAAADAIALGDSDNDVEMLSVVGVGIAMGNSSAAARAAADEVTGTVDNDGLAQAFARHGLANLSDHTSSLPTASY